MNFVRRKVSLQKRRYQKDGFDLDLTYITSRIIAMGFPSAGFEGLYRNPKSAVKKFLELKHPNHYRVYNLCIEREYEITIFEERVARYPFLDHQAPPLSLIPRFCQDAEEWLAKDSLNVIAVHCKAGKGRAGMMICCYLMHAKICLSAIDAQKFFAAQRTKNAKGVTIPSQIRYIHYYEDILKFGFPTEPVIRLKKIIFQASKYVNPDKTILFCDIRRAKGGEEKSDFFELLHVVKPQLEQAGQDVVLEFDSLMLQGDIQIRFFDKNVDKEKEVCHVWFNTAFINGNYFSVAKNEIDKIWKDKKHKKYLKDFKIEFFFEEAEEGAMANLKKQANAPNDERPTNVPDIRDERSVTSAEEDDDEEDEEDDVYKFSEPVNQG